MTSDDKHHIVVIGAGVIGLTTAAFLTENGFKVTIISKDIPGDFSDQYASPWAGAHWRSHASAHEVEQCDWDIQSYDYFVKLMEEESRNPELPRSGVKMYPSLHFWDGQPARDELWWAPYVQDFRQISNASTLLAQIRQREDASSGGKPQSRIANAASCLAMSINVPQYLAYLRDRALHSGAILFQSSLLTDGGLSKALATADAISRAIGRGKVDCYVNATGLGARGLCGDTAVHPIRGQTVLVRGEAEAIRTRSGAVSAKDGKEAYTSYCIPRPGSGTTILGGTRDVDQWNTTPDEATTRTILERAGHLVPELMTGEDGGFEIVSVQCGLRPARKGGPRTEREVLPATKEGGAASKVVHAYGFAGAGYQNSIGVARLTVRNVQLSLGLDVTRDDDEKSVRRRPSSWLPASIAPTAKSPASKL